MNCEDCGVPNPVWFAPNALWNLVMGGPEALGDPGGIICPVCFIRRAEAASVQPTAWVLTEEALDPHAESPPPRLRNDGLSLPEGPGVTIA